jgi:hypothetical protein
VREQGLEQLFREMLIQNANAHLAKIADLEDKVIAALLNHPLPRVSRFALSARRHSLRVMTVQ